MICTSQGALLCLLNYSVNIICSSGFTGPAPSSFTDKIYEVSRKLETYNIYPNLNIDVSQVATHTIDVGGKPFTVQVSRHVNLVLIHTLILETLRNSFTILGIQCHR